MSKHVESPVKRFSGSVELKDPLPYLVVVRFEQAVGTLRADATAKDAGAHFLPVLLDCAEKWELKNFPETLTVDNFPGTPRKDSLALIAWLINEVTAIYKGNEDNDPNE